MGRKGSKRDPGKVALEWQNFCWHPTELGGEGKPKSRDAPVASGFEWLGGNGQFVTISVRHRTDPSPVEKNVRSHEINLDPFVAGRSGRFTLKLTPSDQMRSDHPAGPHTDSKGGQMNKFFDLLMREVEFDIDIDAAGEVTLPAGGPLLSLRDPAPAPVAGIPPRPQPGPHAHVFIDRETKGGAIVRRQIKVDWKPDFIARHATVFRPMRVNRRKNSIQEVVLHVTDGPLVAGAMRDFLHPKKTKGIHYIVDLDGHVFKMMHERTGAFHGAHKKGVHIAAYGPLDEGAKVAKTSIGIEHVAAPGDEWPPPMIDASVDLVQQLSRHFGIEPQNLVGHNDVICLKSARALPIKTKACPGNALPWERYDQAGVTLVPKPKFAPPEDLYGGVFQTGDVLDGSSPAAAIEELQNDLRRIGWWVPGKSGGRRRFGKFDAHTKAGVRRFQTRYMSRQGIAHKKDAVDLATARTIKAIVANESLPQL